MTILANLSVLEQCASEVLQEQGNLFSIFTITDFSYKYFMSLLFVPGKNVTGWGKWVRHYWTTHWHPVCEKKTDSTSLILKMAASGYLWDVAWRSLNKTSTTERMRIFLNITVMHFIMFSSCFSSFLLLVPVSVIFLTNYVLVLMTL